MTNEMLFTAGYVLIKAGRQDVHVVRERLWEVPAVRVVHALTGPDDLICFVETEDAAQFLSALDRGIRKLINSGDIEHTETLMVLAWEGKGYTGRENRPAPAAAWLLCHTSVASPEGVIADLLNIPGVVNAHAVIGQFDLVAYVEAESLMKLTQILDNDLRRVKGIKRTDTRLVLM
jgi:DNA-binding Lrp family transcriptional regulator